MWAQTDPKFPYWPGLIFFEEQLPTYIRSSINLPQFVNSSSPRHPKRKLSVYFYGRNDYDFVVESSIVGFNAAYESHFKQSVHPAYHAVFRKSIEIAFQELQKPIEERILIIGGNVDTSGENTPMPTPKSLGPADDEADEVDGDACISATVEENIDLAVAGGQSEYINSLQYTTTNLIDEEKEEKIYISGSGCTESGQQNELNIVIDDNFTSSEEIVAVSYNQDEAEQEFVQHSENSAYLSINNSKCEANDISVFGTDNQVTQSIDDELQLNVAVVEKCEEPVHPVLSVADFDYGIPHIESVHSMSHCSSSDTVNRQKNLNTVDSFFSVASSHYSDAQTVGNVSGLFSIPPSANNSCENILIHEDSFGNNNRTALRQDETIDINTTSSIAVLVSATVFDNPPPNSELEFNVVASHPVIFAQESDYSSTSVSRDVTTGEMFDAPLQVPPPLPPHLFIDAPFTVQNNATDLLFAASCPEYSINWTNENNSEQKPPKDLFGPPSTATNKPLDLLSNVVSSEKIETDTTVNVETMLSTKRVITPRAIPKVKSVADLFMNINNSTVIPDPFSSVPSDPTFTALSVAQPRELFIPSAPASCVLSPLKTSGSVSDLFGHTPSEPYFDVLSYESTAQMAATELFNAPSNHEVTLNDIPLSSLSQTSPQPSPPHVEAATLFEATPCSQKNVTDQVTSSVAVSFHSTNLMNGNREVSSLEVFEHPAKELESKVTDESNVTTDEMASTELFYSPPTTHPVVLDLIRQPVVDLSTTNIKTIPKPAVSTASDLFDTQPVVPAVPAATIISTAAELFSNVNDTNSNIVKDDNANTVHQEKGSNIHNTRPTGIFKGRAQIVSGVSPFGSETGCRELFPASKSSSSGTNPFDLFGSPSKSQGFPSTVPPSSTSHQNRPVAIQNHSKALFGDTLSANISSQVPSVSATDVFSSNPPTHVHPRPVVVKKDATAFDIFSQTSPPIATTVTTTVDFSAPPTAPGVKLPPRPTAVLASSTELNPFSQVASPVTPSTAANVGPTSTSKTTPNPIVKGNKNHLDRLKMQNTSPNVVPTPHGLSMIPPTPVISTDLSATLPGHRSSANPIVNPNKLVSLVSVQPEVSRFEQSSTDSNVVPEVKMGMFVDSLPPVPSNRNYMNHISDSTTTSSIPNSRSRCRYIKPNSAVAAFGFGGKVAVVIPDVNSCPPVYHATTSNRYY